jgi:hypothetical protein
MSQHLDDFLIITNAKAITCFQKLYLYDISKLNKIVKLKRLNQSKENNL